MLEEEDRILDPQKHRILYENGNIRLVVARFILNNEIIKSGTYLGIKKNNQWTYYHIAEKIWNRIVESKFDNEYINHLTKLLNLFRFYFPEDPPYLKDQPFETVTEDMVRKSEYALQASKNTI